jgi:apolipoprotein N-acyltransferase
VPLVITLGSVVPRGESIGRTASIAIVQGGGPQGTRAATTEAGFALRRALEATRTFDGKADLVVWPENILNVMDLEASNGLQDVIAEARRLQTPMSIGVTERAGDKNFRNAQILVMPDGTITSRYEKVRRVPFGEYMPMRSFLNALGAPTDLVPRDAIPGEGPAVLDTPIGTVGTVISWEVFFGGRTREAVRNGAVVLINPTNGASYRGSILQSQQIASSRPRAIESGRWMVQVAPTGFSAFVSPNGTVYDRIGQTEAAWRQRTVELRSGLTPYERIGDKPWVLLVVLLWSLPTFERLYRRQRERRTTIATAQQSP